MEVFMLRILAMLMVTCTISASQLLSDVRVTHSINQTSFKVSWRSAGSHSYRFAKVFVCNDVTCIESDSGEFQVDRAITNQNVFFSKSFYGAGDLRLVVKGLDNRGNLNSIYDEELSLNCRDNLFEISEDKLYGPIDLNCDGSVDVLNGEVSTKALAQVYPFVTNKKNNEEVTFTSDQRIIINPKGNANNFLGQSCKVKIVTKKFFKGSKEISFSGHYSSNDNSSYLIPLDVEISENDCTEKDGVKFCSKIVDLCFERPFYHNPDVMKKAYDSRIYDVAIGETHVGTYLNKCSVNYDQRNFKYDPKKKDGLDNDCNGELDEVQSYKNYCSKVDSQGTQGICSKKCLSASTKHDVNIFRFPKSCESYGNRFPLWASSTKRVSKYLCYSKGVGSNASNESAFDQAVKKCNSCSEWFNKDPKASPYNTIVDKCGNYTGVKGYKSRAVYTDYTADYENCQALVRCDKWSGGTESDPVYY